MTPKANKNYQRIRAELIRRGTNLARWAKERNYPITTVFGAARGDRAGIRAVKIRTELEEYINV